MLVLASAGLNIEQAEIYKTCENMNHNIHLIPQGEIAFSSLPYTNRLLGGRENVKSKSKGFGHKR